MVAILLTPPILFAILTSKGRDEEKLSVSMLPPPLPLASIIPLCHALLKEYHTLQRHPHLALVMAQPLRQV